MKLYLLSLTVLVCFTYCNSRSVDGQLSPSEFLQYQQEHPEEFSDEFEGDVISSSSVRNKKKYIMTWYQGRVYYDMSAMTKYAQSRILSALNKLERALGTCITFVQRGEADKHIISYIKVISGQGCTSDVGRVGYEQELSLGSGCLLESTIMREFIRALGFVNEQSRSDRDEHVKIEWDNIRPGEEYKFKKENTDNQNLPYDYKSIMHYGVYAFSKNGLPTIIPKNISGFANIGHNKLTERDVKMIKKAYKCQDDNACTDRYAKCADWASDVNCKGLFAENNCKKSCNLCNGSGDKASMSVTRKPAVINIHMATTRAPTPDCADRLGNSCKSWTHLCADSRYKATMTRDCKKTCGFCGEE